MDVLTSIFSGLLKKSLASIRMTDGDDGVWGYFKGMSYDHCPIELAVSSVGFYPGSGLFEAAGILG